MIIWDLKNDREIDSFDCDQDAMFFQDYGGNPLIAEKDYLINCA